MLKKTLTKEDDMEFGKFWEIKEVLEKQYENIVWRENSGLSKDELLEKAEVIYQQYKKASTSAAHSQVLKFLLENGRISVDEEGIFHEKIDARRIFPHLIWQNACDFYKEFMPRDLEIKEKYENLGAYSAFHDFGHISSDTKALLKLGFTGLLDRVLHEREKKENLTEKQKDFYDSCETSLLAIITFVRRLADAAKDKDVSACIRALSERAPKNTFEALSLLVIYFSVHELIGGARVRTLGRMDVLLYDFYKNDIENGTFTKEQISELYEYFFTKLWSMKVPFDLPMMIGGLDENQNEVTNELSYLIVNVYNSLDIHSPKIHVRVSEKTPDSFTKLVLSCIRQGNSSFVFVNDSVCTKALIKSGADKKDALNYVLIGCYEPAVWADEVGCTGAGEINLAKMVELAINGGCDMESGQMVGVKCEIFDFDSFKSAIKAQISHFADKVCDFITKVEKNYPIMYADPILASMTEKCVTEGCDPYEFCGAKYNNTGVQVLGIASLVDSVCAVKRIVFDEKRISLAQLCEILKNNWQGEEKLKLICSNLKEKYGNNNDFADSIAKEFAKFASDCFLGRENGRGGVFKPGLFSIDRCYLWGKRTAATPDGRSRGESLSKNLCATIGKDKCGVTSLINSVTAMDLSDFPNGSVLDVVLHPSAVSGEDGLCGFYGLLKSYFEKGGFAMHGNVFDPSVLRMAQKMPEKYATLQVRLCGWNVYFVNLSKEEQDDFIKQAENF